MKQQKKYIHLQTVINSWNVGVKELYLNKNTTLSIESRILCINIHNNIHSARMCYIRHNVCNTQVLDITEQKKIIMKCGEGG